MTIRVDEVFMGKFEEKMAKLAKIAGKLGVPAPTYEIVKTELVDIIDDNGMKIGHYKSMIIEIIGDAPKMIGDWSFVAKIDHEENLIYSVRPLPAKFSAAIDLKCRCDHCNTNRYRANTFIVTDGKEYLQVGGSCLKNYMGHAKPSNLVSFFDELNNMDDGELRGGFNQVVYQDLASVICVAMYAIKTYGYNKNDYDAMPTKHVVANVFGNPRSEIRVDDCVSEYESKVADVISFMENIEPFGDGSYAANVKQIAKNGDVSPKSFGIATSAVYCYLRDIERKAKESVKIESNHVGNVGERLRNIEVTVVSCRVFDTFYGCSSAITMVTKDGNVFTWFASGAYNYEAGDKFEITGTVKEHSEYKGTKQTVLTRCKIKD
ncbi:hypothetical protein [Aeromonas phage phiWae14]|nr:hypothetical protein [Aeromonas phage phiWae14]